MGYMLFKWYQDMYSKWVGANRLKYFNLFAPTSSYFQHFLDLYKRLTGTIIYWDKWSSFIWFGCTSGKHLRNACGEKKRILTLGPIRGQLGSSGPLDRNPAVQYDSVFERDHPITSWLYMKVECENVIWSCGVLTVIGVEKHAAVGHY